MSLEKTYKSNTREADLCLLSDWQISSEIKPGLLCVGSTAAEQRAEPRQYLMHSDWQGSNEGRALGSQPFLLTDGFSYFWFPVHQLGL